MFDCDNIPWRLNQSHLEKGKLKYYIKYPPDFQFHALYFDVGNSKMVKNCIFVFRGSVSNLKILKIPDVWTGFSFYSVYTLNITVFRMSIKHGKV